jgi:hypothetical protein
VLGTDADVGTFAISYYDFFRDEIHALVNGIVSENYAAYSPVIEVTGMSGDQPTGILHYPVPSPVYDEDRAILIDPLSGQDLTQVLGPSRARTAICQTCTRDSDCHGNTGAVGGTFCQPIADSEERYCLQDCWDDESLCDDDETCDDNGNCVPSDGTCEADVCSAANPHGPVRLVKPVATAGALRCGRWWKAMPRSPRWTT